MDSVLNSISKPEEIQKFLNRIRGIYTETMEIYTSALTGIGESKTLT